MTSTSCKNWLVTGLTLTFCAKTVSAQFNSDINQADCQRFCHDDCGKYFSGSDFSPCVSANVHCSCGLPWYGTLVVVIAGFIFGLIICCGLFRYVKTSCGTGGAYGGVRSNPITPTNVNWPLTNDSNTRVHATTMYPPPTTMHFGSGQFSHNANSGGIQPSFNPSFMDNVSAPGLDIINHPSTISPTEFEKLDAPPTYDEVTKTSRA